MSSTFAETHPRLSRLLSIHNPFYLISVLLVLVGLHEALAGDRSLLAGWLLMGILCGYTLLLLGAGYTIVRFGQVWDDARMILLVIVLLFVALSVSFDKILLDQMLLEHRFSGARFLVLGLAFSIAVSETVFRSLGIRLAKRYRLPYYLILTLLFVYPMMLSQLSVHDLEPAMSWAVFLFPLVAATTLLSLLPAARSPGYREPPNGTPWNWPWFPWSLFVFLLVAIALRSYSLSMTFEIRQGTDASFRLYFLSPLVLAGALLLLEVGIANHNPRARVIGLVLPAVTLLWSLPGAQLNAVASGFLTQLTTTVGSPVQLTLVSLSLFYALAWGRGFLLGEIGLTACALLASVVDQQTLSLSTLTELQWIPLALVAVVQLPHGLAQSSSWRVTLGGVAGVMALGASGWNTSWTANSGYLVCHGCALGVLAIAAIFNDRSARTIRRLTLPLVPVAALIAATLYEFLFPEVPRYDHALVISGLIAVATLHWRRSRSTATFLALVACIVALLALCSRGLYLSLQFSPLQAGLPWLAGGLAALAIGTLFSLTKGGAIFRGWRALRALSRPIT